MRQQFYYFAMHFFIRCNHLILMPVVAVQIDGEYLAALV